MKRIITTLVLLIGVLTGAHAAYHNSTIASEKKNDASGVLLTKGDSVRITGVVQSTNLSNRGIEFSLYDGTGSIIVLDYTNTWTYKPAKGDQVTVRGKISQYARSGPGGTFETGLSIIAPDSTIGILSRGNTTPAAIKTYLLNENLEAEYAEADSLVLINPAQWTAGFNGYATVQAVKSANKNDTVGLYIANAVINAYPNAPTTMFHSKGIVVQNDPSIPYLSNYFLFVFNPADLVVTKKKPNLHTIGEIRHINGNGIADSAGVYCLLKGIVETPNASSTGFFFSLQDNTGAITIAANAKIGGYDPALGDMIELRGTVSMYRNGFQNTGLIVLVPDSVSVISSANKVYTPSTLLLPIDDSLESKVATIKNVTFTNPASWKPGAANSFTIFFHTAIDSFPVVILKTDTLYGQPALQKGVYSVTGVVLQADNTQPYLQQYYLHPRYVSDISNTPTLRPIKEVSAVDANGVAIYTGMKCILQGSIECKDLVSGGHFFAMTDNTGAIFVTTSQPISYFAKPGDVVKVTGTISQQNGMTEIMASDISFINSGTIPPVRNILVSRIADESDEAYYEKIQDVHLIDQTQWSPTKSVPKNGLTGFLVTAVNAFNDTFQVLVPSSSDLFNAASPKGKFSVSGVIAQDDPATPFNSGYFIVPSASTDMEYPAGMENTTTNAKDWQILNNPTVESVTIVFPENGQISGLITMLNISGQELGKSYSFSGTKSISIPVESLKPGMYFIRINADNVTSCKPFIKE